jgi:hypothetical protein
MSSKRLLVALGCLVGLVLLINSGGLRKGAGNLFGRDPDSGISAPGDDRSPGNRKARRSGDIPQGKKYVDPRVEKILEPKMTLLEASQFDDYLQLHGRSSRALVSVYGLTRDEGILEELKKHLDSPEALLCLSQARQVSPAEKLSYALLYIGKKPDEMQGYLLAAAIGKEAGKPDAEIVELVKKGMSAEKFSLGSDSLALDMREALASSGMSRENTEIHMMVNDDHAASLLLKGSKMIEEASNLELTSMTDPSEKNETLSEYVMIAQNFKELLPYDDRNGLYRYYTLMEKLLPKFEGDIDLGEGLGSAKELQGTLKQESTKWLEASREFTNCLKEATPVEVNEFLEKRSMLGEAAARAWLVEKRGLSS